MSGLEQTIVVLFALAMVGLLVGQLVSARGEQRQREHEIELSKIERSA